MEVIIIKRLISFVLAFVFVFAFSVSSFASITADQMATSLQSGWGTGTTVTYPTGYSSSWFYRVVYWLSQIKTDVTTIKTTTDNIYSAIDSVESYLVNYLGSSSLITTYLDKIRENTLTTNSRLLDIYNKIPSSADLSNIELALGTKTANNNSVLYCLNEIMSHTEGTIGEFYYHDRVTKDFSASSDYFFSAGTNLFNIASAYATDFTTASYKNYIQGKLVRFSAPSLGATLSLQLVDQSAMLSRLAFVFASDDDIQLKRDSANNMQSVNDNFLKPSASHSVKADDISGLSGISTSFTDTFTTGTSSSGVFDVLNSSDPWEWFTDDVANSLLADSGASASTFSLCSASVGNDDVITSYYEDNMSDFYSWLDLVGDTD